MCSVSPFPTKTPLAAARPSRCIRDYIGFSSFVKSAQAQPSNLRRLGWNGPLGGGALRDLGGLRVRHRRQGNVDGDEAAEEAAPLPPRGLSARSSDRVEAVEAVAHVRVERVERA